jgi:hypothetical protein
MIFFVVDVLLVVVVISLKILSKFVSVLIFFFERKVHVTSQILLVRGY